MATDGTRAWQLNGRCRGDLHPVHTVRRRVIIMTRAPCRCSASPSFSFRPAALLLHNHHRRSWHDLGTARRRLARLMLDRSICIPRESYLRSGLIATCVHTVWRVRVCGQYKLDWGDLWVRWVSSSHSSASPKARRGAPQPSAKRVFSAKAKPLSTRNYSYSSS